MSSVGFEPTTLSGQRPERCAYASSATRTFKYLLKLYFMKKNEKIEVIVTNRRAKFDYEVIETYTAGIVLLGPEIKSIRERHVNLNSAFAKVQNGEVFLYGMQISPYKYNTLKNIDEFRVRKLLLNKSEIRKLQNYTEKQGYTLIPLNLFLKNGWAKITLGVCRGRKKYNKKELLKERAIKREAEREFKKY